ncbi:hypothetical protein IYX23_05650 [Methylocystis sp. L43]|uniref:hypothetical protein n=1 Tax=unclassified Methylocystis TaxID=2625913 RepID=UPI0018C20CF0|nr:MULTISPECIES: hypothetical protein [unclassified Methylocystis]MBG0797171.1 hypothetical protein [Methylocystis sp. L43]MBG0804958.1 hypothetical protein [Methylocystis sp. H15]
MARNGRRARCSKGGVPLTKPQRRRLAPPRRTTWARIWVDELESETRARLSVNARRALDALVCHHFRSAQVDNGVLQVSHKALERAGVGHKYITAALAELEKAGLARKSGKGLPSNPWMARPNLYELPSYLPTRGVQAAAKRRFVWIPVDVMESPAWRSLSINARRIMDRLLLENFRHMGVENGKLRVSVRQFEECGVAMRLAKSAIAELVDGGLVAVMPGAASGSLAPPNLYRITFHGTLDDDPTWAAESQQETIAMSNEKFFSHPPKVKRAHPPIVKREKPIHTPQSLSGAAKITPPNREASIISSGGGRSGECSKGTAPLPDMPPSPGPTAREMRVEAYAIAHANWIRRFGLPTHDEVALMRACYVLPKTTAAEWTVISAHFTAAIAERKASTVDAGLLAAE